MKSDMVNMNEKIEKLERIVDRKEQYSCSNCLVLHGIAEGEHENTDEPVLETLNEKMHKKTKNSQIKGESQLNSLSEAMDFMINKFEERTRMIGEG